MYSSAVSSSGLCRSFVALRECSGTYSSSEPSSTSSYLSVIALFPRGISALLLKLSYSRCSLSGLEDQDSA
ncbi:unnamed protein product [Arabidopsis halleri]